jgi:hypothetical protein
LETEKLFLTKDIMCEGCFKEDLRCNGLRGSSEENAEKFNGFCIDMVCDENELHDLLEKYGRECRKCNKIFFTFVEIKPEDIYLKEFLFL